MTLYELLADVPLAKLARLAALDEAARPLTVKQRKARTRRYLDFLCALLAMRPAATGTYVLVDTPYCDGCTWTWEASLVKAEDFAYIEEASLKQPLFTRQELTVMDDLHLEDCELGLRDILPEAVDYTFFPWENVLATEVHFPKTLGRSFRLPFLSSVVRTMSYAGFTKAQRKEAEQQYLALMKARGEVKRMSKEEMEKRRQLCRTLFPAPPDQEQSAMERAMQIDTVLSLQGEYRMYKAL